ncbi:MAG: hypothetical protein IJ021_05260 [Clostridia bacterium]|nr:hypothetical protein [Clostridia bacterium]
MKRIIALVLTLIMVVCMVAACGGTGTGNTTGTTGSSNSTTQTSQTTTPIPEEPKDESLLVYLNFDFDNLVEGDEPYFEDMSGNGNHAYVGGRMVVADGPTDDHGEAIELDTVGNYLTIKHNDMFNFKAEDEYTIDFWFQADTEKLYSQHTWPCPFTKGSPGSTSYFGCWINAGNVYYGTGTYDIENKVNVTGNKNAVVATGLDDNWHHFTAVQKDGKIYTYLDAKAGATEIAKDVSNTWDFYIGGKVGEKDGADVLQQFFGCVDEFKIYNRALTYQEISGIEVQKPEKEELVLDLDFTKLADGKITDLTGKGHDGVVSSGNITVTEGGAKFDGTAEKGSYITIKNAKDLQFSKGQSFTFEIQFKVDTLPAGWSCLFQAGVKGEGWYGIWGAGDSKIAWGGIGGNYYATKTALAAGTWHTMTVVQNAETGEITTYFDGVEGQKLYVQDYVFDGDIYIGTEVTVTGGVPSQFGCKYDGEIKSVKIYNYAVDMTK